MSESPIKVLIVEDEPAHAEAVRRALAGAASAIDVEVVDTLRDFRAAVGTRPPDLVLIDFMLPDGRAESALVSPPEQGSFPMVVMTSHGDEQIAVAAIRRGALDYVVKSPASFAEMPRIVERTLREWRILQESRRAQEALRENERRLATLMANLPGMAYRCQNQSDWQMVFVSEGCTALTGHSAGALTGGRPAYGELVLPECRQEVWNAVQAALAQRRPFEITYRIRAADGRIKWVWERGSGYFSAAGDLLFLEGFISDISDRKAAEARAAREAMRTEFLLELHQRAPQLSDKELFDHVLDRAVQLTASAIGFFHQISEDQRTIILTTWNREALQGCTAAFETHYPLSEAGNWVDCVREKCPIVYNDFVHSPHQRGLPAGHTPLRRFMSIPVMQDGRVRIIFGVGNKQADYDDDDVTQLQIVANELHKLMVQRSAQAEQRRSEERFRQLVETTSDLIWETDAAGRYTYLSPKVRELLGYEPAHLLGRRLFSLTPASDETRAGQLRRALLAEQKPFSNVESVARRADGTQLHLETSGAAVFGADGTLIGFRGMDRDITARMRLEAQFRQAQKLEGIGQLAGGVAHDFNNILAAMMMYLGLLRGEPGLGENVRLALKEVDAATQRAAALTRQLLMFSRRSVLAVSSVDLNRVVSDLLKMLGRVIGEQIAMRFEGRAGLPAVEADAGMLEQVVMNLVVNARDAMPAGGRIEIVTRAQEFTAGEVAANPSRRAGYFVCLSVSDTGSGMDAETMKKIFEPFFTTKAPGKGTGLGLATVHGIVAQHKGWVEVDSTVGQGTTFRVYLPATGAAPMPAAAGASAPAMHQGSETVLVVEDDPVVRKAVCRALESSGYRVHQAANGQEAVKLWQLHGAAVNLLFTDMVMPEGMTGLELAEKLQALKPGLRVIISSGYSAEIVRAGVPDRAGVVYLPKPYPIETLASVVRSSLG
jgi:two-component system cell cycle sensor histidine kinase/response regulator CckA